MPTRETTGAVVVGAGPAGLAAGACLRRAGVEAVILEREPAVASSWRRHYDRLHLHTDRDRSALPYRPFDASVPRYPSRTQVVEYLERYAADEGLEPRLGEAAESIARTPGGWRVRTTATEWVARAVVIATGYNEVPLRPRWPGQEGFPGPILHSSEYRSGARFAGQRVLVVGLGNSGAEIGLDLHEQGARPSVAVRGPVCVIPRDLLGLPILAIAIPLRRLPPRLADLLTAPVLRSLYGDLENLGLHRSPLGPFRTIAERRRVPLIDIGTIDLIRTGRLHVHSGIAAFDGPRVIFDDGARAAFDAVILATGYRPGFARLFSGDQTVARSDGTPLRSGVRGHPPGLYFCGFDVAAAGMLRQAGLEARRIAARVRAAAGEPSRRP